MTYWHLLRVYDSDKTSAVDGSSLDIAVRNSSASERWKGIVLASKEESHVAGWMCAGVGRGGLNTQSRKKEGKVLQQDTITEADRQTDENTTLNTFRWQKSKKRKIYRNYFGCGVTWEELRSINCLLSGDMPHHSAGEQTSEQFL